MFNWLTPQKRQRITRDQAADRMRERFENASAENRKSCEELQQAVARFTRTIDGIKDAREQ